MPTIELDVGLECVLWACQECNRRFPAPDGSFCFTWVLAVYREEFSSDFHQSRLHVLAKRGLLRENDSTRTGHRRYYTLT